MKNNHKRIYNLDLVLDVVYTKDNLRKIEIRSFSVVLDDIGVFPSENYIRVIWVGLNPEEQVLELQKNIDESLKNLFKKERDFKPHLTLARVKYIEDKKGFIGELKKLNIEINCQFSYYQNLIGHTPAQHHLGVPYAYHKRTWMTIVHNCYFHILYETHCGQAALETMPGIDTGQPDRFTSLNLR